MTELEHSLSKEPQCNLPCRMISDCDPSAFVLSAVISLKPASFPGTKGSSRVATLRYAACLHGVRHQTGPSRVGLGGWGGGDDIRQDDTACLSPSVSQLRRPPLAEPGLVCRHISQLRRGASSHGGRSPVPSLCTTQTRSVPVGGEASAAWLLPLPQHRRSTPGIRHSRGRQAALSIN